MIINIARGPCSIKKALQIGLLHPYFGFPGPTENAGCRRINHVLHDCACKPRRNAQKFAAMGLLGSFLPLPVRDAQTKPPPPHPFQGVTFVGHVMKNQGAR